VLHLQKRRCARLKLRERSTERAAVTYTLSSGSTPGPDCCAAPMTTAAASTQPAASATRSRRDQAPPPGQSCTWEVSVQRAAPAPLATHPRRVQQLLSEAGGEAEQNCQRKARARAHTAQRAVCHGDGERAGGCVLRLVHGQPVVRHGLRRGTTRASGVANSKGRLCYASRLSFNRGVSEARAARDGRVRGYVQHLSTSS